MRTRGHYCRDVYQTEFGDRPNIFQTLNKCLVDFLTNLQTNIHENYTGPLQKQIKMAVMAISGCYQRDCFKYTAPVLGEAEDGDDGVCRADVTGLRPQLGHQEIGPAQTQKNKEGRQRTPTCGNRQLSVAIYIYILLSGHMTAIGETQTVAKHGQVAIVQQNWQKLSYFQLFRAKDNDNLEF